MLYGMSGWYAAPAKISNLSFDKSARSRTPTLFPIGTGMGTCIGPSGRGSCPRRKQRAYASLDNVGHAVNRRTQPEEHSVAADCYTLDIETVIVGVQAFAEVLAHRIGTLKQIGDPVSGLNKRLFHIVLVEDIAVGIDRPSLIVHSNAGEDERR